MFGFFFYFYFIFQGVIDRLFARIGATDNLVQHQSTFMSEMLETAFILAQATEKSLVVVDEIGRNSASFNVLCCDTESKIVRVNTIS